MIRSEDDCPEFKCPAKDGSFADPCTCRRKIIIKKNVIDTRSIFSTLISESYLALPVNKLVKISLRLVKPSLNNKIPVITYSH